MRKRINRKQNWKRRSILGMLVFFLVVSQGIPYSATEQKDASVEELREQQQQAQEAAQELQNAQKALQDSLGDLNSDLYDVSISMENIQKQIEEKQLQVSEAETLLNEADANAQKQYEDMKKRIQFMYENGNSSIWYALFHAGTFSEFLNRLQYISEVSSYDRKMLDEYNQAITYIDSCKKTLEEEQTSLTGSQNELENKKDDLSALITDARNNLNSTNEELEEKQQESNNLEEQIAAMEAYERQLEEQKAKEEAAKIAEIKRQEEELKRQQEEAKAAAEEEARKEAEKNQEKQEDNSQETESDSTEPSQGPGVTIPGQAMEVSANEAYLLAAIIDCEAGGESYETQLAVGSVVLNRVDSSYFPNTITDVIYQSGQFSPVASGRLALKLEKGVSSRSISAANEVLAGTRTVSCLYFRYNTGVIDGIVIGSEVFY